MSSFLRDINLQASFASLVVTTNPLINQVLYDTTIDTSGGLYVGTGGLLNVVMAGDQNDNVISFNNIPSGSFLPIQVKKILSTSTCGNVIVFLKQNVTSIPNLFWEQALFNWDSASIYWN